MSSLICALTNDGANNRNAGDLRRHRAHYDVIVMLCNDSVLSARKFKNVAGIAHTHSQGHQGFERNIY